MPTPAVTTGSSLRRAAVVFALALAAILGAPPAPSSAAELTPVLQAVPSPPRWYLGDDGRTHLQYELLLTNGTQVPLSVAAVTVLDARGARIRSLSGDGLTAAMGWPDAGGPSTELGPFSVGVVWLDLAFRNSRSLPDRVRNRVTVTLPPTPGVPSVISSTGPSIPLAPRGAPVIAPPLRGGRWVAVVGPHRRALQPVGGRFRNGQRFAIDFAARLDAQGRTHSGSPDVTTSYFNYGQPVLAVGAGKVVAAVDRYGDQVPSHNAPVSLEAADGNHVIIRLRQGFYAGYAHLERGSLRVRRGDEVRAGQVLAKLGNSGNTTGPHLHFQLMTRPSLLDADGVPFLLDRFRLDGRADSLDTFLAADLAGTPVPLQPAGAGTYRRRGLTGLEVLSFG